MYILTHTRHFSFRILLSIRGYAQPYLQDSGLTHDYKTFFPYIEESEDSMRLRVIQLCLSGYHARATALAYVTSSGGRINSRRTQISTSGISTIVVQRSSSRSCLLQNKEIMPSYYARGNVLSLSCRGESSASLEATGQDPSELFDIYLPPPSLGVSCQPPEPAGFTKPRRLVHADGDWHRSVHVWLHNVKVRWIRRY